jgi:DNA invertase Pin-like site-specific DNA recombinase
MTTEKIKKHHLQNTAFVYLRQSSPTQVKRNVEGSRRQRQMERRMKELGWPATRIRLLGGDTGNSGSTLHGREDYQTMVEGVLGGQAGAVAARELSRLVRDNQDWNQLVRLCRHQDVLLVDEHRVYNAADPQDRVVLGVAGAFNEFELAMIVDRMQESRRQKAARGELYDHIATGYVLRSGVFGKHPDDRVQRAVAKVFDHFDRCTSVLQLHDELLAEGYLLPTVPHGRDWREVEWITPSYGQLVYLLKHPVYAGIYVRGLRKTYVVLDEEGHVKRENHRVPHGQWDVYLKDHHEAYIDQQRWERSVEKITANAPDATPARGRRESANLLGGLLRCRRCGCILHATYPKGAVVYVCRGGAKQRERSRQRCFSFPATHFEERIGELILEVVRPAGLAAAHAAAQRLAADHVRQRQLIVDRLHACREAEVRAAREYKATDATYTSVRQHLASEWEEAIAARQLEESRVAEFDEQLPVLPTAEQQQELDRLGEEVDRIWHHPRASMSLKKQIVQLLIEEIVIEFNPERDELVCQVHWSGGHHTDFVEPRRRRNQSVRRGDLVATVEVLRKIMPDKSLAATLNRVRIRDPLGKTWNAGSVKSFRGKHGILVFSARRKKQQGWLTQAEAANRLSISAMSVTRLVRSGVLPAEQPGYGVPAVITASDLDLAAVKTSVVALKNSPNRPLTDDPNQLTLFPVTDSQKGASCRTD